MHLRSRPWSPPTGSRGRYQPGPVRPDATLYHAPLPRPQGLDLAYRASAGTVIALPVLYLVSGILPQIDAQAWGAVTLLLSALAAGSAVRDAMKYGPGSLSRVGLGWALMGGGMLSLFAGEVAWVAYQDALGVLVPVLSAADALYFLGYLLLIAGSTLYLGFFSGAVSKGRRLGVGLSVAAASAAAAAALYPPIATSGASFSAGVEELAFAVLSLVLAFSVSLGALAFMRGRVGRAWALLLTAVFLAVAGNLVFTYALVAQHSVEASLPNVFYGAAYVIAALGFHVHAREF